ncbi:MAG TPA: hypothetical protein VJL31_08995 [Gemmatimonadales bacterium]|nr:hypothetical protein [Gemmatimonadales bacterium]
MAEGGCFKNLLAGIGCLTVLTVGGIVGWQYRAQLGGLYRSIVERESQASSPGSGADSVPTMGRPSALAFESARSKQEAIARRDGPGYVTLSADEMASLIAVGLGPAGRAALDSIAVTLHDNRLAFQASLNTSLLGAALPGPLAGMLSAREPVRVSGPARVAAVGAVAWKPDSFVVRSFPFPESAVPVVVNKLTGRPDGIVPISVPPTVGDLRIRTSGVTFYRR